MAIQVLDLHIQHRSGRSNGNADALSRSPLPAGEDSTTGEPDGVVAAVLPEGETDLPTCQQDKDLATIVTYPETGVLLEESLARTLTLSQSQYVLEDDVLYKVEPDSTLRVIPPQGLTSLRMHMGECSEHTWAT